MYSCGSYSICYQDGGGYHHDEELCANPGAVKAQPLTVGNYPNCAAGEIIDPVTGECNIGCPAGQEPDHDDGSSCICSNNDMQVDPNDPSQCIADCSFPFPVWNPLNEQCQPECENFKGKKLTCSYGPGDTPPTDGCDLGCFLKSEGGISVVLNNSGIRTEQYTFTGAQCATGSTEDAFCSEDPYTDRINDGLEDGPDDAHGNEGTTSIDDDDSINNDGSGGTFEGGEFDEPPSDRCSYSDDGIMSCNDQTGTDSSEADGEVQRDDNADGVPEDGYTFSDHIGGSTPVGATIIDPDTGEELGVAVDQDGDGITDGIDTDGDGDVDVDGPGQPGSGCDNNGDGVCDDNDKDNDGDGQKGQAGDCIDDPDTEENECSGTGEGTGGSVSGFGCQSEDKPQCQPDKKDIQGRLFCQQLILQWEVSCQFSVDDNEDTGESLMADKPEDDGSEFFDEKDLEDEGPGFDENIVQASGGCFQDLTFDALGNTYVVPLSNLCGAFSAAGAIILMVAYMVAGMILYRGVFT